VLAESLWLSSTRNELVGRGRCCEQPALDFDPELEGGDLRAEATQFDPEQLRLALDHGEVVELDGGTLC
jgi:hypothetical protein